jgi:hypothetical protein
MHERVWKALGAGMVAFGLTSALTIPSEAQERQAESAAAHEMAKAETASPRIVG